MARYEYKLVSEALTTGGTVTDNTNGCMYATHLQSACVKNYV